MLKTKFFCIIFLIFSLTCKISAEENFFQKNVNLNFEPYFSTRFGVQDEFVYMKNSLGETKILSELNWEQKAVFFGGIKAECGIYGFNLAFKYQEALPLSCGTVFDSDWRNLELSSWELNSTVSAYKTNYSESECKLERYYNWAVELNYVKEFKNQIGIKFFAQFDYSYSSFVALGGNYWYGKITSEGFYEPYTDVQETKKFSGKVLALERINYIAWAGFALNAKISKFDFTTSFAICPYIHTDSLDSHFITRTFFLDRMNSFFTGAKLNFSGKFYFDLKNFISLTIENTTINSLYGKTYSKDFSETSKYTLSNTASGASFQFVDFTFSFQHKF